jgi:hypothetical protein
MHVRIKICSLHITRKVLTGEKLSCKTENVVFASEKGSEIASTLKQGASQSI